MPDTHDEHDEPLPIDRPALLRPRWTPESADDARYARQGYSDSDSARYDAAWRSFQPRD